MTDLICVDAAALEDLMLQDQLARGILARAGSGDRLLVLLGTGEAEERCLETEGHSPHRVQGALMSLTPTVESTMRVSVRSLSNRLTDEGVHAVGMMAADRGLVSHTADGLRVSSSMEQRVWTGPGVVPVLGCLIADPSAGLVDVHPLEVARVMAERIEGTSRVVMLARRRTPSLMAALAQNQPVSKAEIVAEGAFLAGAPLPRKGHGWYVSHVAEIGAGKMAKVL